jgi:hypothetical protein
MAGKTKRRGLAKALREDLSKPSKWRLQHGGFEDAVRGVDPETGCPIAHRRATDSLGLLLANGTITQQMHEAGVIFRTLFQRAALDRVRTMSMIRVEGGSADPLSESQASARQRVAKAVDALGGFDSPGGSIVWHVTGVEVSIRDWALRQGWAGRHMHPPQAQGLLVGALGMLAAHFGLVSRQRAA